jgi:hypothetical protein
VTVRAGFAASRTLFYFPFSLAHIHCGIHMYVDGRERVALYSAIHIVSVNKHVELFVVLDCTALSTPCVCVAAIKHSNPISSPHFSNSNPFSPLLNADAYRRPVSFFLFLFSLPSFSR